mgnify:CR=1 FL=1
MTTDQIKEIATFEEDQSKNGVRVHVYRYKDGMGTITDASCQCYGNPGWNHSDSNCPVKQKEQESRVYV